MKKRSFALVIMFASCAFYSIAQELDDNSYDETSIKPIRYADIMYKRTIWKRIDLREKNNEPLFAQANEITRIIIDAIKAGVLRPFKNDSMSTRMTYAEFIENLKIPGEDAGLGDGLGGEEGFDEDAWGDEGDDWGGEGGDEGGAQSEEFFPNQIYLLEVKADLLIDKKRSIGYYDVKTVKLIIPSEFNPTGLDKDVAVCSYKELAENVFFNNKYAIWFNTVNIQQNRNLTDAFEMALYAGRIIKYGNAKNLMIEDIYNGNQKLTLFKAMEFEYDLVEYESNLWSN